MRSLARYDDAGRIVSVCRFATKAIPEGTVEVPADLSPEEVVVGLYVDRSGGKEAIKQRPTMSCSFNQATNSISTPDQALVTIHGPASGEIESDGEVELIFELPGSYHIKVTLWPYLDWETTIEIP